MNDISLRELTLCFEGAVPAVIATSAGDGTPNVTYLSRVRCVDDQRVALSNQFFSKTQRNLADAPRASRSAPGVNWSVRRAGRPGRSGSGSTLSCQRSCGSLMGPFTGSGQRNVPKELRPGPTVRDRRSGTGTLDAIA